MKFCMDCKTEAPDVLQRFCITCGGVNFNYGSAERNYEIEPSVEFGSRRVKIDEGNSHEIKANLSSSDSTKDFTKMIDLQNQLIRAQNRTTHAVRAFVSFLFIQLSATTLALVFWQLSNLGVNATQCMRYEDKCSGNAFLQFLAVAIWIAGVIWSSSVGWRELEQSKV